MDLTTLLGKNCEWLKGEGAENDIVISTRIRLARNLRGFPFLSRAIPERIEAIERQVAERLSRLPELQSYHYLILDELPANDVFLLFERHLISKEHAHEKWRRAVTFRDDESIAIMINEEDHFRIQVMQSGFELAQVWKNISALDDLLASVLEFSFHRQFGYLTACPTNAGTGMRASVMLHLPALRMTGQMDKIFGGLSKLNLGFRGFYGEGTMALGDFLQLSNQVSLGKKEEEFLHALQHVVPQIANYERQVRQVMMTHQRGDVERYVNEAYRGLFEAEKITSEQSINLLSAVRMGVHLGLLKLNIPQINRMFIMSQPAHLQKQVGRELTAEERDKLRAQFFKNSLQN